MGRNEPSSDAFRVEEYRGRINRVLDYIDAHLERSFNLAELAAVANFSKFHFHRLFAALTGETLFQFIARVRLERAAAGLLAHPKQSITEIALDCGFSSSAAFARAFRGGFGVTPSQWRRSRGRRLSNVGQTDRKDSQAIRNSRQAGAAPAAYTGLGIKPSERRPEMNQGVEVRELPEMMVAYVRHVGPYQGDAQLFERLWGALMSWAGPRKLVDFPDTQALIVYHDDPEITEKEKLRVSVCLSVPPDTPVDGAVGKMTIPGGRYALARFTLTPDQYGEAWQWVFAEWLPGSGYQPDDRPCFEMYPGGDAPDASGRVTVDIAVPVRPL
ncbi:MAG: AraC family transcriptional regulator [Spirochaetales bacterium]|nr:AraC family transcriptional regulator [Spirochaetales bacterium]